MSKAAALPAVSGFGGQLRIRNFGFPLNVGEREAVSNERHFGTEYGILWYVFSPTSGAASRSLSICLHIVSTKSRELEHAEVRTEQILTCNFLSFSNCWKNLLRKCFVCLVQLATSQICFSLDSLEVP